MAVDVLHKKFSPCAYIEKKIFAKYKNIEDYYNSHELKNLQNNLSNGIKDEICKACWNNEDVGITSMRQSVLRDRCATAQNRISQVKLHTGNTCNLACMMCFPSVSSTWNKLWIEKNYPERFVKEKGFEDYDNYVENYIKKNIDDILFIETLGGEPLFSKTFVSLLNWIVENGKSKKITLYIITNLTILPSSLVKILSCFKKIVLTVSLEGIGSVNNYIRWGSNFEIINQNIKIAKSKGFDLGILATVNSLNLHRIHEIYNYAKSIDIPVMQVSLVKGWPSLHPSNLPEHLHGRVDPRFRSFLLGNTNSKSLKKFIQNWDKQRKIDILDFMPEFEEFMK